MGCNMGITNIEKYNQTHMIRPKLKTINGQSLYSGGNIEVGSDSNTIVYYVPTIQQEDDRTVCIYHYGLSDFSFFVISISGYYNNEDSYWANYRKITVPAINGFTSTFYVSDVDYTYITIDVDDASIWVSAGYPGDVLTIDEVDGVKI